MKTSTIYIRRFLAHVLSLSLLGSCSDSKDDGAYLPQEPESVVFTVMPQIAAGYGNIPATYSTDRGGVSNVSAADYRLRYILEVWSGDGSRKEYRQAEVKGIGEAGPEFSPRLLSGKYKMVLWADFVTTQSVTPDTPAGVGLFYNADNLNDITLLKADCNDDAKDAYTAVFDADLTEGGLNATVILKRPLAKVRLVATDADRANGDAGLDGCTANLVFSNYTDQVYDALDGSVAFSGVPVSGDSYFPVGSDYGSAYGVPGSGNHSRTLAWDYVFVPAGGLTTDITVRLQTGSGGGIALPVATLKTIRGVTFRPNVLVTAAGRFFTTAAAGNIEYAIDKSEEGRLSVRP